MTNFEAGLEKLLDEQPWPLANKQHNDLIEALVTLHKKTLKDELQRLKDVVDKEIDAISTSTPHLSQVRRLDPLRGGFSNRRCKRALSVQEQQFGELAADLAEFMVAAGARPGKNLETSILALTKFFEISYRRGLSKALELRPESIDKRWWEVYGIPESSRAFEIALDSWSTKIEKELEGE